MILITSIMLGVSALTPDIKSRMLSAYYEYKDYFEISKTTEKRVSSPLSSSVGTRLEMLRITPLILRDHTLFGVGNGNYNKAMKVYTDNKELNPAVNSHSHAHNVFVNVLIVKGLFGLVITCLVLFYPLYVYIKTYESSKVTASIGILFIILILLVSMNETAPFVKSNFVATYLLISVVIFENHMKTIKRYNHG